MIAPAATEAQRLAIARRSAVGLLRLRYRERVRRGEVLILDARELLGWADVTVRDHGTKGDRRGAGLAAVAVCYDRDEDAMRARLAEAAGEIALCRQNGLTPLLWIFRRPPGGAATRTWGSRWVSQVEAL